MQSTNGNSYYHGLALGLRKRLSYGLQLQLAYTYSKAIDQFSGTTNASDMLSQSQRGIYYWDMNQARGLSAFDIRNSFVSNLSYELPFGKSLAGPAGTLARGWQLNAIINVLDGHPLTLFDNNAAQQARIGSVEAMRVDLVPGGKANPVLGKPERYFDPSQFAPSQPGFFGNLGRNTLTSPGMATLDLSLFKNFKIGEESRLQFRSEFFNLLNRANFGAPDATPFTSRGLPNPTAGRIVETSTKARTIQFGLRFNF